MKLFSFSKYSYKASYEAKTKTKIVEFTEKYEDIFLKVIKGDKSVDQKKLSEGIYKVLEYIYLGLLFKLNEDYNNKTPIEKKAETLYKKLSFYYDNMEEEFKEEITNSIYSALGIYKKGKTFKKESNSSYFIKYTQNLAFYAILNLMEKKLSSFEKTSLNIKYIESSDLNDDLLSLLEDSGLKESIPEDIFNEVKECIIYRESPGKHLLPYLEILKNIKDSCEELSN